MSKCKKIKKEYKFLEKAHLFLKKCEKVVRKLDLAKRTSASLILFPFVT
jgi:hypothetical protein